MDKLEYTGLEIAVVGMACRFPGASNITEFWDNLKNGKESLTTFSDEELREYGITDDEFSNANYVKTKGLIDKAEYFDASFFGISPSEADALDPQFRLLLQCAYNSLEDAGYDFTREDNNTGVFVGAAPNFNWQMQSFKKINNLHSEQFSSLLSNDKDFVSTRLSYLLNLHGHSHSVYTACSTSLVAIDMACQSLLTGKCDVTLAGGVSLSLPYKAGYTYEPGMFMSQDGHTRSFDVSATGTIWSDGVGTVVLKRLDDALRDGDHIHAIIKGSATNNDGNRKVGYTAPSVLGQAEVIKKALRMAEVPKESIAYIEGHGSATGIGDKIEVNALKEVFGDLQQDYTCHIGSVKSNFGHLNVAAGVAGFIKTCLMLKHDTIPPSLHFETPNSELVESNGVFAVNSSPVKYEHPKFPFRAGVNSFGIGGTNAHIILEKAPPVSNNKSAEDYSMICLSAKTPSALNQLSSDIAAFVQQNKEVNVADLAYTLQTGRQHQKYRRAIVAKDVNELLDQLSNEHLVLEIEEHPEVVFLFPGMGGFFPEMGKDLYEKEEAFRNAMDACFEVVKTKTGLDFKAIMYGEDKSGVPQDFQSPQLMVFSFEYALARLLESWGIVADTTVGYSLGEYVSACIAGIFTLEDVLHILLERGRLINTVDSGEMVAIPQPKKEIESYLTGDVHIAIDNGQSVVVAGRKEAITQLSEQLEKIGILTMDILDKYAVHTPEMNPIAEEFKNILKGFDIQSPNMPMVSNVTGEWCTEEFTNPEYWIKHLAETVDFSKVVNTLVEKDSNPIYLEVGVGKFMGILLSQAMDSQKTLRHLSIARSENRIKNDEQGLSEQVHILQSVAKFWEHGGQLDWNALNRGQKRQKLSLPTYPFEGTAYSLQIDNSFLQSDHSTELKRKEDIASWFYVPSWKKTPLVAGNAQETKLRNILLLDLDNSEGLVNLLIAQGHQVAQVNAGSSFQKLDNGKYKVNYSSQQELSRLFEALNADQFELDTIIDLTGIVGIDNLTNLEGIVNVVQGFNQSPFGNKQLELITLSSELFKVYGSEEIVPGKSAIVSAAKVIPQENSHIQVRLLEVEKSTYEVNRGALDQIVSKELNATDEIVSYRGKYRWSQTFEAYPINHSSGRDSRIKDDGTYVIIGGLGDVGYTIAQYLVENFESNVVIVGRSKIPGKAARKKYLESHGEADSMGRKIARVNELEKGKGKLILMQADSTNQEQMNKLVEQVSAKYGQVNGVFHSAGDVSAMSLNLVNSVDSATLTDHFNTKVEGLSVLQNLANDYQPEFVAIVSSTSSILGGIGMIGYASANQYVDSLVASESDNNHTQWLSLNYTYLTKELNEGTGSDQEEGRKNFEKLFQNNGDTGNTSINADESKQVFEHLLSANNAENQIIVSPIDFPSLIERLKTPTESTEETAIEETQEQAAGKRPANQPFVAPVTEVEQKLAKIWESLFGFEIGTSDDFFQLGGDSLGIIKLISQIQKEFGVAIEIGEVFKNTSFAFQLDLIDTGEKAQVINIEKAPLQAYYRQSEVQKGFFILNQMNPDLLCYNNLGVVTFEGDVKFDLCQALFQKLIDTHDILRTSFHVVEGEAVQKIHDQVNFELQLFEDEEQSLDDVIRTFHQPFDLGKPELIRAAICLRKNGQYCILTDIHHIILDRVTFGLIIEDLQALNDNKALVPSRINYTDFSVWQQREEFETLLVKQEEFWLNEFSTLPDSLRLPTDYPRTAINNYNASSVILELSEEENAKLLKICQEEKITMYTLMLSMYYVLLFKLSNQNDIVVGTTVLGRQHEELERVLGVFANTIPIRTQLQPEIDFRAFLNLVKDNALACFSNQDYPFEKMTSKLDLTPNLYQNPLFDVMFEYYNFPEPKVNMFDSELVNIDLPNLTTEFDFCMRVSAKDDDSHVIHLDYRADLYGQETMERFIAYYRSIINSVEANINVKLSDLNLISPEEQKLLIEDFNSTHVEYENEESIVTIFERMVDANADEIAVADQSGNLTYKELNERANQVANYLVSRGVLPGNMVGLLLERSLDMVVGIMGILKAGAGYLPLDPQLSEQRIRYMLDNSRSSFLLTSEQNLEQYTAYLPVQAIDSKEINKQTVNNPELPLGSNDLAYCIFTSGSSGMPKGVMMSQLGVTNLVKGLHEVVYHKYGNKRLNIALLASFSFDASVQQIFGSLLQGHSLYIVDEESRKDGSRLRAFYNENKIDLSDGTPTHLRLFVNANSKNGVLDTLSSWIMAGEELTKELVLKFFDRIGDAVQLYNFYGPTEACVDSTSFTINRDQLDQYDCIPIGKPLPNERVYVTDDFGNLVPRGVIGELCIAGDGLAQRYVGNEALTSEMFDSDWIEWENRVYKTGDLVKWLPDGNLVYHGRIDDQIKLRGYRIELSEITHHLNSHPEISQSVVMVRERAAEKHLVAYYEASQEIPVKEIRTYLGQMLPQYMIPSYYVQMEKIPLTINGKVNRNTLPDFEVSEKEDYVAPSSQMEHRLVEIWSEVLKISPEIIGVNSNFFDLGGNSLSLVFLKNKIQETLQISISLKELIHLKDIENQAIALNEGEQEDYVSIPKAEARAYYPLSSSQKRLYFLSEFDSNSIAYNQPQCFVIKGALDIDKLQNTFQETINRHESLRTRFELIDEEPAQFIDENIQFEIQHFEATSEDCEAIISEFVRPFDLSRAPLMRVGLIRIAENEHLMMFDMHHIISDGISIGLFIRDMMAIYKGETLDPLALQYKDYAVWQQEDERQEAIEKDKLYWNEQLSGLPSPLNLPSDRIRPKVITYKGNLNEFSLNEKQTRGLNSIAEKTGATMFSVVLGVFNVMLCKLSGQNDLIVGTSVAGRNHADIQDVMGVFLNTLPLRNQFTGADYFSDLVLTTYENALSGFEHQNYPYEQLIGDLNLKRDTGRNPLFDVMLEYANFEQPEPDFPGLELTTYNHEYNVSKFDLTLHAYEVKDHLKMDFQYSTDLFDATTIDLFIEYFKRIVDQVIDDRDIRLDNIELLNADQVATIRSLAQSGDEFEIENDIVSAFEKVVESCPTQTALSYRGDILNYQELNERSNQMAHYLISQGVAKGDVVGLITDRSQEMIVGLLGILKSGAAYLPIDPKLPKERISYFLKASQTKLLFGDHRYLAEYQEMVKTSDIKSNYLDTCSTASIDIERSPSDLAYCIFTSGSTGVPKGVLMEHKSIVNLVEGLSNTVYQGLNDSLRVGLLASYSFDASCQQIFGALLQGHALVISTDEERMDGNDLYKFLKNNAIEISDGTPTHFGMFLSNVDGKIDLPDLKRWMLAGEALPKGFVKDFYDRTLNENTAIFNLYGPTETCVDSTYYKVDPERLDEFNTIPIGRPLSNERLYVVDNVGSLVAPGVVGELCIAGSGLARGYVQKEAEKDRFVTNLVAGEERVYRTGDLVRWLPDGNLEYCARKDSQVKLRGYRIEPGEIEHVLNSHPAIVGSAIVLKKLEEEEHLVAYFVSDQGIDDRVLREYLLLSLPDYMIPTYFVGMEQLPLTSNGKLDRAALPDPELATSSGHQLPASENEERLLAIWASVLNIEEEKISTDHNFMELGGHSLKAIQIANNIKKQFGIEIKLVELFQRPTIIEQARFIDTNLWLNVNDKQEDSEQLEIEI